MFKHFFTLEWKSFIRSASFKANLFLKILMVFGALYFIAVFTVMGIGLYFLLEKVNMEPFATVNRFLLYYLLMDLVIRFFVQKIPVLNIRPLLFLPIKKNTILSFTLGKSVLSYFNWVHLFFLVPFSIVLYTKGFSGLGVLGWFIGIWALIFINNFLNILSANKDFVLFILGAIIITISGLHYYQILDTTLYTAPFFDALYSNALTVLTPLAALSLIGYITFRYFKKNLYLDAGLSIKQKDAQTQNLSWLNQFGTLGTFLKNDIKLIKRNKRSRSTIVMSVLFIFYGLLFFGGAIETYEGPVWRIFAGLFVTGGFLFTFGQFVPSWDSAYYPLMMSQNIKYREYLNSKWWLMVIATVCSLVLSSFYLYFGWEVYLAIVVGAVYNIGVNAHIVLWAGAYVKTPIDLSKNKNVFGDKQAFNIKSILLTLPKLALPMILYAVGHYLYSPYMGYLIVALTGVLGFAFKDKVFRIIENIYKNEKYKTLAAYKQGN
ncbi:MAG: hypothetical protein H0X63_09885 [Flavobacteriales bacterium]|nr:hypothetical protein [Flavobacteriales bacterium]